MYVETNKVLVEGNVELQKKYISTVIVQAKLLVKILGLKDNYYIEYKSKEGLTGEYEIFNVPVETLEEDYEYTPFKHDGCIAIMELGHDINDYDKTTPYIKGVPTCLVEYLSLVPTYQEFYFKAVGTDLSIPLGFTGTLVDSDKDFKHLTYLGDSGNKELKQLLSNYITTKLLQDVVYRGYSSTSNGFLSKPVQSSIVYDSRIPSDYFIDLQEAEYFLNTNGDIVIVENKRLLDRDFYFDTQVNVLKLNNN